MCSLMCLCVCGEGAEEEGKVCVCVHKYVCVMFFGSQKVTCQSFKIRSMEPLNIQTYYSIIEGGFQHSS